MSQKDAATVDAYLRILRQFTQWVTEQPGHSGQFLPSHLTTTAVEMYLSSLKEQAYSVSHRTRVKSVIKQFCQWLIEEKEELKKNPTRGIEIKSQQQLAPRILNPDQRFVLRSLVEQAGDLRGKALFALGYWAGCRVSDISYLWTLEEVAYYLGHVTAKGTPAIQTTVRYTQVSREQVKAKLRFMRG